jgi:hypothetical protein
MIDPKFNELAEETEEGLEDPNGDSSSDQAASNRLTARKGLSVNDTIAANANMSVGARGVDVSGVRSGAGAGAGMTINTPGEPGESPAPNVVPGSSSTGTTPQGQVAPGQIPTLRLDEATVSFSREEIAARAYRCWLERGSPEGSPEEDWQRAEEELRAEQQSGRASAAFA